MVDVKLMEAASEVLRDGELRASRKIGNVLGL